ncbi:hypothetical protein NDU88_009205 [Pleurodeles waltl]|uniref:Uncharacterized protein n=1 Tax=Pleurodeles waltl TaxID=8319 RepID=A0AAV7NYK5_PLEWA|nr:hypothetical protein NDU88_009205 [Pleurodeles waltl]
MAARQGDQETLEPERVAQVSVRRKDKGSGKPASEVPTVQEEAEPEGEALEPTGEQVAELGEVPRLSKWQQEGGPTREAFCEAQKSCPTLEGLWHQAADQASGKEPGSHLIYWEDSLLYIEPKVPEPGEVPQKALGFSPFELIYGHPVRGPLSLVKEALEKAPSKPPQDLFSYMLALRNQTARFRSLAQENLEARQEDMKHWYDQNTTLVEVQPGQKVWVMAPVEPRVLQDKWTGPFEVVEHKSGVIYLVNLQTPRNPLRVLHVNRLKAHFERTELSMLLATDDGVEEESEPLPDLLSAGEKDGSVEGVNLSCSLTAEQQRDCRQVLGQFTSLFSLIPGVTHLCTHDVDIGDSTPIKQKVYRVTDKVRAIIKDEVSKMLTLGVIEHSSSLWASPVVLVPKAAAPVATPEIRMCMATGVLLRSLKLTRTPFPELMSS